MARLGRPHHAAHYQLYSDDRGVCRVYEMSIGPDGWSLWREGDPFTQRFTSTFEDDGNTIAGRWERQKTARPTKPTSTWSTDGFARGEWPDGHRASSVVWCPAPGGSHPSFS
jgi:hypothetical protein